MMRSRFRILRALLVGALLTSVSCGEDDLPNEPTPPESDGTMTGRINGTFWAGDLLTEANFEQGTLLIDGRDNNFQRVQVQVAGVSATGVFQLGAGTSNSGTLTIGSSDIWIASGASGSGSVTITTLTATRAAGTFAFIGLPKAGSSAVGKGNRTLSEGTFDVRID